MTLQMSILMNYETIKYWILAKKRIFIENFSQFSDCQSGNVRTHGALTVRLGQKTQNAQPLDLPLFIGVSGEWCDNWKTKLLYLQEI